MVLSRSCSLAPPARLSRPLENLFFFYEGHTFPLENHNISIAYLFFPLKTAFLLLPRPPMSSPEVDSALFFLFPSNPVFSPILALFLVVLSIFWFYPGGLAWSMSRAGRSIPGPPGIVLALSGTAAHRALAGLARSLQAVPLMAFSVGFTRFVVSSHPDTAKEILNSSAFADRPIKESAYELLFHRAMGFAPFGEHWRNLRRISATYLFSPRRISAFGEHRRAIGVQMVNEVKELMGRYGEVEVKRLLHFGSLNNVMMSVFGKRFDFGKGEGLELEELVREGYELLGVFNWSDHFPVLGWLDLQGVRKRCRRLVARVNVFVGKVIEEHRQKRRKFGGTLEDGVGDFVDVLIDLEEEKLSDADMVAVLWVTFPKDPNFKHPRSWIILISCLFVVIAVALVYSCLHAAFGCLFLLLSSSVGYLLCYVVSFPCIVMIIL